MRSLLFCTAFGLIAAACDPRFVHDSDLRPAEIQRLAGVWEGRASLSFTNGRECPRAYDMSMLVGGGNVSGELVDNERRATTPATFTTFVEYDGSLHAALRTNGRDLNILGSFSRDSFSGTVRSDDCRYVLRLRRRDTPSS